MNYLLHRRLQNCSGKQGSNLFRTDRSNNGTGPDHQSESTGLLIYTLLAFWVGVSGGSWQGGTSGDGSWRHFLSSFQ
jgi:hypothetical protein